MRCSRVDAILDAHGADALSAAERARVDAHVAACERCAGAWLAAARLAAETFEAPRAELFERAVRGAGASGGRTAESVPRRRLPLGLAAAAALAALAILRGAALDPGRGGTLETGDAPRAGVADVSAGSRQASAARPGRGAGPRDAAAVHAAGVAYEPLPVRLRAARHADRSEVVQVFTYACGPCYAFEPYFEEWSGARRDDVEIVRLPAPFDARARLHARAYYTAEALGKLDEIHAALFAEIHERGDPLASEAALAELFARFGVGRQAFAETFASSSVTRRVTRAERLVGTYGIAEVPSLVVNGAYLTRPDMAGSSAAALDVTEELIASERRSVCPTAPPC